MSLVYPVIHHLDSITTLEEAKIAFDCNADGLFLISHYGDDLDLLELGSIIKARNPSKFLGINMLSKNTLEAIDFISGFGFDGIWSDNVGISSEGITQFGQRIADTKRASPSLSQLQIFGSVAFKYQKNDPDPSAAAKFAVSAGMIPTTSGSATGKPPTLEKISSMSASVDGLLAVASGMSCENIEKFAPFLSHVLVSTFVSRDEFHFDSKKLADFVKLAK